MSHLKGRVIIISGPSGAGKSTVVRRLLEVSPIPLKLSVSATTRPPRPGEQDGVDYYFVTPEEFRRRVQEGEFLEYKEVFGGGVWYGTLWREVTSGLNEGKWVILEIDVEGARTVREQIPEAVTIFIHPGSLEELERRLRRRGTESDEALQRRLQRARQEMAARGEYQYEVINRDVEQAVQEIVAILKREAQRDVG